MVELTTTLERVAETPYLEFERQIQDSPLAIIYPRHRSRGALVSMFLEHYGQNIVYYDLGLDDSSLTAWLAHMIEADVFPLEFGQQTRAALQQRAHPEDLAAAFGADLDAWGSDLVLLFLDSFDNLEVSKAENKFFHALPAKLPSQVRVVINARLLDLQPWNDLILDGQAVVVGTDEAMDGGIYGENPKLGQLEVLALSGGHVYMDGQPVIHWDGSLPRHLFYYFVDHPMVTRDEIFAVFWPKMSVKEATNVFHVTKRKISERLGYELTNYSGGFYIHSPRLSIHYDAHLFEIAVEQAIEDEDNAPAHWYRAVQLYRSDFLPYVRTPWVQERREILKNRYAQALIGLGRMYRGINEYDRALGYLLRALRLKPDWEDVHRDVMLIYSQQGRQKDAIAQYQQLERTLKAMFNIQPSKDTRRLYEVIAAL
jgi:DNA-binding SARP family transcriptional activator